VGSVTSGHAELVSSRGGIRLTWDSISQARAPLAQSVDQFAGPDDGQMGPSHRAMNSMCI
jgi:hypothetical protein